MYRPCQLPGRASNISGELGWGGKVYIYVWLECSYDPPRRQSWTACVHFRDSYPIDISHPSFNFLYLLLLQVSISVSTHLQGVETMVKARCQRKNTRLSLSGSLYESANGTLETSQDVGWELLCVYVTEKLAYSVYNVHSSLIVNVHLNKPAST